MWWEEVEGEGEVGGGEDCQGLDKDVGDGFVFGEVWVELVPTANEDLSVVCFCNLVELLDKR